MGVAKISNYHIPTLSELISVFFVIVTQKYYGHAILCSDNREGDVCDIEGK